MGKKKPPMTASEGFRDSIRDVVSHGSDLPPYYANLLAKSIFRTLENWGIDIDSVDWPEHWSDERIEAYAKGDKRKAALMNDYGKPRTRK